ncbi:hypothetical protein [Caldisphaera sp.]
MKDQRQKRKIYLIEKKNLMKPFNVRYDIPRRWHTSLGLSIVQYHN